MKIPRPASHSRRLLAMFSGLLLLAACHSVPTTPGNYYLPLSNQSIPRGHQIAQCQQLFQHPTATVDSTLDPQRIRLFNWNIQKGATASWLSDFDSLAAESDIVLLQEAMLSETPGQLSGGHQAFWTFAPGYRSNGRVSGVMTGSRAQPTAVCSLTAFEPLLQSPKAINITRFALAGRPDTLLIANVHSINFAVGTREFSAQLTALSQVLRRHRGPLILAGDFNTWSDERLAIVEQTATQLGLRAVQFARDRRTRVLGSPLDHLFVRGLRADHTRTAAVSSSDHNPMLATLRVTATGEPATAVGLPTSP